AKADSCNRELGGAGAFGTYEAAILDPGVETVFVATPTAQHLELTLAALAAGKHVIVEKPPFLRSSDFHAVEQASLANGRRVFIAENYFYRPLTRRLRELITSGAIGEVRYLIVKALKEQKTGGWRNDESLAGGGALFEGGIHWMNLLGGIGLTIDGVDGYRPGRTDTIERSILVVARYAEGAVGTLHHAWDTPSLLKGLRLSRIFGTRGSVAFESNGLFVIVAGHRPSITFPGFRDISGYGAMFDDFLECIGTGREPEMTLTRARRDLELVEMALKGDKRRETRDEGGTPGARP
ncbi:MAG TPA: Gfo/Idh/MocA family oxidoreductase, partial [Gaiellaceae bacterium]|nr:Gfo/Idh/MocA family oxidoreductase [Gaiellaceae bacterium]